MDIGSTLWMLMPWCFSTRVSVATMLSMYVLMHFQLVMGHSILLKWHHLSILRHLESLATQLFVQQFVRLSTKKISKFRISGPLLWGLPGLRPIDFGGSIHWIYANKVTGLYLSQLWSQPSSTFIDAHLLWSYYSWKGSVNKCHSFASVVSDSKYKIILTTHVYDKTRYHTRKQSRIILTHCGIVTPYGNIELGQHWLR